MSWSWTDRMKQTFSTFKRMAFPLYAGYLLFIIVAALVFILSLLPVGIGIVQSGLYYSDFSGLSGIPGMPGSPSVPVPPGGPYGAGANGDTFSQLFSLGGKFIFSFFLMLALTMLVTAAFWTGIFHLTKRSYTDKAQFKDYSFKGFFRVLAWFVILTFVILVLCIIGVAIAFSYRPFEYSGLGFLAIYALVVAALAIFLAPWISISVFYILNHREFSFGQAFKESWRFYRRHMGSFWGCFLTALVIEILIGVLTRNSSGLSGLLSFVITPFISILPIVWVLTHEEEEHTEPVYPSYTQPLPQRPFYPIQETLRNYPEQPSTPKDSLSPEVQHSGDTDNLSMAPTHLMDELKQGTEGSHPQAGLTSNYNAQLHPPGDQSSTPESAPSPQEPQINFCPTCGKGVRPGASYCSQCGTKL